MGGNIHIIIGASGGIGSKFVEMLSSQSGNKIYAFSRTKNNFDLPNVIEQDIDVSSEISIAESAKTISEKGNINSIIVATGFLHDELIKPEKSLQEVNLHNLEKVFAINAFAPILIAKYFLPLIHLNERSVFAAISARVSSISDNKLGGWYAYRASKAALNMLIKTLSIESKRKYNKLIVAGLHPGTVNTCLSKPFQSNVPKNKLFTLDYSVKAMLKVLDHLSIEDSGKLFAYDGQEILP